MDSKRTSEKFNSQDTGVSVAIRIRPFNQREKKFGDCDPSIIVENNSLLTQTNPTIQFNFDHVLQQDSSTLDVYNAVASDVVSSCVDGINGTIFAYGQTSSGKTYTMFGTEKEPGIMNLSIKHIFSHISQSENREFLLRVSYVEIYNEVIKDLLKPGNENLKIHQNPNGEIFVGDLTEHVVASLNDVENLLIIGDRNRHIGETNMNEKSSRSHTIFRMTIESRERVSSKSRSASGAVKVSNLNLVDLAGSERVGHTGAEGIRLKEGGHINKSLLALSTVIAKLSEGRDSLHIPYRDSKLTRMLQSSLGGNAKTGIICTITPSLIHMDETLSTLRFASRAKNITNKPRVNEIVPEGTLLKIYKQEINELKKKLDQANESSRLSDISKEELLENREKIKLEAKIKKLGLMILDSSKVEKNGKSNNKSKRRQTWVPSSFNSPNLNTNNENDTDIDQMPSSEIMGIIMKMIKGEIKEEDVKSLELLKLYRYIQDLKDNASNTSNERSNLGSGDGEHKRMLEEETQVESKRLKTSHIDSNSDLLSQDMLEDELLRSLGVSTADDLYAYLNDCNKKLSEYEKLNSQQGDNLQKLHFLEEKLVDYNRIENERNDLIEQINQAKTMLMANSNNGTDGLTLLELMTLEKNKVNAGIQYLSRLIVENHADDFEELDGNLLGNIGLPSHHKLITILKEHKKTQELLSSLCTKYGLNDISLNSLLSYFEDERLSRGNAMEMKNSEFINLKNSYEELQTKYTNLEDEFKQKTEEKNLLDQDTETLRHSLETYQKTNEALLVDMNNLQLENAGLKSNLSTQRSEYERLKEEFTFKMDQTEEFEIKFGNEIFKCNTKNLIDDQIAIQNRIDEVLHLKESDSKELQQYRLIMNEICTSIGYNAEQWSPSEIKHQLDKVLAVELQKGKAIQLDYEQQLNDIAYSMGGEKLNTFEDLLKFFNTQVVPRAVHSETCKELEEKYQVALTMNEMSTKKIESILDANDSNSVKDVKIFKEYEQSVAENVELEKQLEDLKLSFVTLQSNSAELMELNKELTQALSSAQMENEALKSEIDAQQKMVLEKMDEQQILKQRIDDLVLASESNENAEQLKNAYLAQNEKVTDLNNQLNVLNSCLNEKNEFIASLQELVKQNNDAILLLDQELQEKSKMAESEISNLTQSLENSTKSLEHALIVQKNELESQWRDKYDQILNEFNQVSAEILEKNKQIEQLNVNLLQVGELQETLDAAKSNMEQLDSDRKCAEEFSNNLRVKINRLIGITTGYMESTNARLKEHERKCDILVSSINGAHKSYFGVKQEKMKLDNKVSQYEGKIQDLGLQITSLNSINEDQITEKEKQIENLENFIKSSLEENESLKASIETHLSKISDLFADNKLLKDSISQLNGELENIKSLQEENTQLRAKMRSLESEYSELKMQLSDKEAYLRTVQTNVDVQKDRSNQENTLPNILPRKPLSNSVQEPVVI